MSNSELTREDKINFIPGHLYRKSSDNALRSVIFLCTKPISASYVNDRAALDHCMITIDDGGLWTNHPKRGEYDDVTVELMRQAGET